MQIQEFRTVSWKEFKISRVNLIPVCVHQHPNESQWMKSIPSNGQFLGQEIVDLRFELL